MAREQALSIPVSLRRLVRASREPEPVFASYDVVLSPVLSTPAPLIGELGPDDLWFDIFVMEQAITDPAAAADSVAQLSTIEQGNSLALVLYWVHMMRDLGQPSATIRSTGPSAQAFELDGTVTLVARNVGAEPVEAVFVDQSGTEVARVTVPPRSTLTQPCEACGS